MTSTTIMSEGKSINDLDTCTTGVPPSNSNATPAIKAERMAAVLGTRKVLDQISFTVEPGEIVGVVGPNGAGKTTLLRVLLGLVPVSAGTLEVFGHRPGPSGTRRHFIGYVPQRSTFNRRFPISVLDVVRMGRTACRGLGRFLTKEDTAHAISSLEKVGAAHLAHRPIGELSGGQQQRAFLARALCGHTKLLLLDEPNTGLDLPAQIQFFELLQTLQQDDGLTIVVVAHDLSLISQYAHRIMGINRQLYVNGRPDDVLNDPRLDDVYGSAFGRFVRSADRGDDRD